MEQDLRRDSPPARLEDALADRRGAHDARTVAVLGVAADKVRDGVEPFGFPREDAGPHLVALVGADFALEGAFDGAEFDGEGAFAVGGEEGVAVLVAGLVDAEGEEGAEEVGAGDVEVGVVGAVGFWDECKCYGDGDIFLLGNMWGIFLLCQLKSISLREQWEDVTSG